MKTKHLFLLPALAFLACAGLHAQVTIGSVNDDPAVGALLDLNSPTGNKGGLLLSNVSIANLNKIPTGTNLFPGIIVDVNDGNNPGFKGAIVYNTNPDIGMGIYVWTGTQWIPAGTNILYDAEGNDYTIGNFGDAGTWMTQNLRTTDFTYDSNKNPTALSLNPSKSSTNPYYAYPNNSQSIFDNNPHYGLLYNWTAASGRTDTDEDNIGTVAGYGANPSEPENYRQGICPDGWHLPSDWEWSQLEQEIATNPKKYSDWDTPYSNLADATFFNTTFDWRPASNTNPQTDAEKTYWSRQMKSTEPVDNINTFGMSKSREEGGFDALLVGYVDSGTAGNYGSHTYFWSSSSYSSGSSSGSTGVDRYLISDYTSVGRYFDGKYYLFSVRCKKD